MQAPKDAEMLLDLALIVLSANWPAVFLNRLI